MERKVILKKGKEYSIERFHPWIFSGAIQSTEGDLTDGCWVEVLSYKKKVLGRGHYQKGSIMVRMLSFDAEPVTDFWASQDQVRIAIAEEFRNAFCVNQCLSRDSRRRRWITGVDR